MSKIVPTTTDLSDKEAWVAALKYLYGEENVLVYDEPRRIREYNGKEFLADVELHPRLNVYTRSFDDTASGKNTDFGVNTCTGELFLDDEASKQFLRIAQDRVGMEVTEQAGYESGSEVIARVQEPLTRLVTSVGVGMQHTTRLRKAGRKVAVEHNQGKLLLTVTR